MELESEQSTIKQVPLLKLTFGALPAEAADEQLPGTHRAGRVSGGPAQTETPDLL